MEYSGDKEKITGENITNNNNDLMREAMIEIDEGKALISHLTEKKSNTKVPKEYHRKKPVNSKVKRPSRNNRGVTKAASRQATARDKFPSHATNNKEAIKLKGGL